VDIAGVRSFLDAVRSGREHSLVSGSAERAVKIVDAAIEEVATLRGRLGAFERSMVESNIRSLQIGLENVTASESRIRDADFAAETAALARAQVLQQAGTSVLATANLSQQTVLALLQ
jgi:flagellin